jgi:hypothetical protein
MCDFITPMLAAIGGTAGATAAGATAGAVTAGTTAVAGASLGTTLAQLGTLLSVGGSIAQGLSAARAAKANVAAIEDQKAAEAQNTAIEDRRTRARMQAEISQQTAELAARGVQLDSPTAILLGQEAAREMSFASQTVRQTGTATQTQLTNTQKQLRAGATQSLLKGFTGAAGTLMTAAPDLWPELTR